MGIVINAKSQTTAQEAVTNEKNQKEKADELTWENKAIVKEQDAAFEESSKNKDIISTVKQALVEVKEKKAAAEQSQVEQDKKTNEASNKAATQMSVEAKAKAESQKKIEEQAVAEQKATTAVESEEEAAMKVRVAKQEHDELSKKAQEREEKQERAS